MQSPTVYHIITVSLTPSMNILIKSSHMKCSKVIRKNLDKYFFFLDQAKAYLETKAGIEIIGQGEVTDSHFVLIYPTFATF